MPARVRSGLRVEWANWVKRAVNLIRAWTMIELLERTACRTLFLSHTVGERGRDWHSRSGKSRAHDGLEDKNVFFMIVSLGLRDLRGCARRLDTM